MRFHIDSESMGSTANQQTPRERVEVDISSMASAAGGLRTPENFEQSELVTSSKASVSDLNEEGEDNVLE